MRTVLAVGLAALVSGCATQFSGAAKVKNGPNGCRATCDAWEMELVGMMKMGEYSDGCICQVRPMLAPAAPDPATEPAPAPATRATPTSDASAPQRGGISGLPAVAGVYMQMQAAAAAAAAQQRHQQQLQPHTATGGMSHHGW